MALRNLHYLQELKEQLFQKIHDEWESKWQYFPTIEQDDFSALPSLNAFIEELHDDIDATLKQKLPSKERLEMMISKENLRRILKNKHEIRLQSHTRNCLAYYLDFDGWEDFKEKVKTIIPHEPVVVNYVQVYQSFLPQRQAQSFQLPPNSDYIILPSEPFWKTTLFKQITLGIIGILLMSFVSFSSYRWYKNRPFTPEQLAKVKFEIIEDYAKPNNDYFKISYDVSSLNCDSVMVDYDADQIYKIDYQQHGYSYKEIFRNRIDTVSHTYFMPNVWEIKLIVNNQVIKTIQKIVYSGKKWTVFADGSFQNTNWINHLKNEEEGIHEGILHLSPDEIDRPNSNLNYWVNYKSVQDFNIDADSLTLETRIRNNYKEGGISCYDSPISITTNSKKQIGVNFVQDCIEYARITVGKIELKGNKNKLSFMDLNLQEWQIIKIKIKNRVAYFYANDKEIFKIKCEANLGLVKQINYNFKGSGSVDWVKLSNSYTGKIVFSDDFERK